MIAKLKQFFTQSPEVLSEQEQEDKVNLAAASLLLEVVLADETISANELALLPEVITKFTNIDLDDAAILIDDAKQAQHDATSLYEFTHSINEHFNLEQKKQLLLAMWRLAYADGELCRYEDQIIRRTAELLHLKHSELIMMRNRAIET